MTSNGGSWTPRGLKVPPAGRAKIEGVAAGVRAVLLPGALPTAPVLGVQLFEHLHNVRVKRSNGQMVQLDWGVVDLPPTILARTLFSYGSRTRAPTIDIELSEASYRDLRKSNGRARFTLCHEIGHAVVHAELVMALGSVPHAVVARMRDAASHPPYEDAEWQADAFAAALLMPAAGMELLCEGDPALLSSEQVEDTFQVSHRSAEIRIGEFRKHRAELLLASGGARRR